jgi:hypothetical protein
MISVDKELVFAARRMITAANVHSVNTLIFQYEQATAMKNDKQSTFVVDPKKYERRLQEFVLHGEGSLSAWIRRSPDRRR